MDYVYSNCGVLIPIHEVVSFAEEQLKIRFNWDLIWTEPYAIDIILRTINPNIDYFFLFDVVEQIEKCDDQVLCEKRIIMADLHPDAEHKIDHIRSLTEEWNKLESTVKYYWRTEYEDILDNHFENILEDVVEAMDVKKRMILHDYVLSLSEIQRRVFEQSRGQLLSMEFWSVDSILQIAISGSLCSDGTLPVNLIIQLMYYREDYMEYIRLGGDASKRLGVNEWTKATYIRTVSLRDTYIRSHLPKLLCAHITDEDIWHDRG